MPLFPDAEALVRLNLSMIAAGLRPAFVVIGRLTDAQHAAINVGRLRHGLPVLENPEVLYLGRHHYTSRSGQGYGVDDMWMQIASALGAASIVHLTGRMTALENPTQRNDGYGNLVRDRAILELTARKPRAELFSVIPKGDKNQPAKTKASPAAGEASKGDPG
ncbi:hypothetical protein [Caenispirillum bisanense]|uniref:hypothetical protein n=1 Tax=Caenispirillum bisanense TaxID=414052 RepID=UPI0031D95074